MLNSPLQRTRRNYEYIKYQIRLYLTPSGLPRRHLRILTRNGIVEWNGNTGEVRTLPNKIEGTKIDKAWVDELIGG